MNKYAVYHSIEAPYSYPKDKDNLNIMIRVAKNDIRECNLYYKCRYDWELSWSMKKMDSKAENELFEFFEVSISVLKNRYRYYFELIDFNSEKIFYDERGFREKDRNEYNEETAFQFAYIGEADLYEESKWLQESIVYQIFPDRFCNDDNSINPKNTLAWGEEVSPSVMFGGDLKGIIKKINYLKDLGVNLIYLTPVFESSSNHKYNTKDYYKIDPHFGTISDAKKLVDICHENKMKVIFDAVFNHTGSDFFAFEDLIKNGQKSKYKDWYFPNELPINLEKINYYTFANNATNMPKINTFNKEAKKYLLDVAKYWIKEIGIDGWRLDVCDEVDHVFWKEFRLAVKQANKDAVIIGEIMHESKPWLRGDELDTIMNYPFRGAVLDFFAKKQINAKELDTALATNVTNYMNSVTRQMWNLIGSHDTARFLTDCDENKNKMILATVLQFTYIGVPYIYYGDEIGMTGEHDPYCRKCMIWEDEKQDKDLLNHYKKLIKLRKENRVLIYGKYKSIYKEDFVIAFERVLDDEKILVVLNNSEEKIQFNCEYSGEYYDLYNNKKIIISKRINLDSMQFLIINLKKQKNYNLK